MGDKWIGVRQGNKPGFLELTEEKRNIVFHENIQLGYDVNLKPFARGKFAAVKKCKHKKSNLSYAAKVIRKRRGTSNMISEINHEVAILNEALTCPRIVDLQEVFESNSEVIIVLELLQGGELQSVLDLEDSLSEHMTSKFLEQLLEALQFLHERNIAHLDIKPQNILLTNSYPNCDIKLCDFGLSRSISSDKEVREIIGTPDYVAPEILKYEPISLACDIWSVGVLTYVMLSGHSPFAGNCKQETLCNITQGELDFPNSLFSNVCSDAIKFISMACNINPTQRPSALSCLSHEWLKSQTNSSVKEISTNSVESILKDKCSNVEYVTAPIKRTSSSNTVTQCKFKKITHHCK